MKKATLFIGMLICAVSLNAQSITKTVDEMTDKVYYSFTDSQSNKDQIILSEDNKEGLTIFPIVRKEDDKFMAVVKMVKRGVGCVENGFMIIKFKDGSKVQIPNWKSFNCDETFYFNLIKYKSELSTKPIDKIMVQNGRNYESETQVMTNPNYFIEFFDTYNKGF